MSARVYDITTSGIFVGRRQIVAYFEELLRAIPDFRLEIRRTLGDGAIFVVE
jgi:predicted SnoaL-like aldol condensation-catalyzing enzyme